MNVLDHCTVRKVGDKYHWFTTLFLGQHGDHAGSVTASDIKAARAQVKDIVESILRRKASYEAVYERSAS